ncbi:uncharacterized protein MELLADRAFT_102361 [Melampsora larici-populina 98AG31]|uniref:Uncharacterized protein n=1 Tax=Melampsora larici-populina (strain 98AG31 / pathotype 3-4-7) TaxID=747676 RepID=F4R815_MELLP|nr:uncharacterized protein MELLADRAFT_102361 [Melampsora larici-populina 98AG31]EGG11414.1 hypothetical protein MELLADRAFT_102361 [Melampsora larici-populina 98AG31]
MATCKALLEKRAASSHTTRQSLVPSTPQRIETPPQQLPGPSSLIRERSLSISRQRDPFVSGHHPAVVQYHSRSSSAEMESPGIPGPSTMNRERSLSIPRQGDTLGSVDSPAGLQYHSRSTLVEMESPGKLSITRQRASSGSGNSSASGQHHSRSSSVKMQSPGPSFISRKRSTSISPRSLYSMSHIDIAHLDKSRPSSVGTQSPPSFIPRQRSTLNSPTSLYNMPRQSSTRISPVSPYNTTPAGMDNSNISLENSLNQTGSSVSDGPSSEAENFENMMEQVINDELGDDEENWEDVVYYGPSTKYTSSFKQGTSKKGFQINDDLYPFETLENIISVMCYGKAHNLLSQTQHETVRSAVHLKLISGQSRDWSETKRVSEQVWNDSLKPNMISKVDALQKSYGLKDTMLQPFIDKYRKLYREEGPAKAKTFAMQCQSRLGDRMWNPYFKLDVSRHDFGGGLVWNETHGKWTKGGSKLEALQQDGKVIDNTFGFKLCQWEEIMNSNLTYYEPGFKTHQKFTTAQNFLSLHGDILEVVPSTLLKKGQQVENGDFVSLMTPYMNPPKWTGQIRTIWSPKYSTEDHTSPIISLEWGSMSNGYHSFYGMQSLKIDPNYVVSLYLDEVRCSINVQHNCYDSQCQTGRAQDITEHQICEPAAPLQTLVHKNSYLFIVNSGTLYNSQAHYEWAHIEPEQVTPEAWSQAIHCGIRRWKEEGKKS